jgi:hypothetical protein
MQAGWADFCMGAIYVLRLLLYMYVLRLLDCRLLFMHPCCDLLGLGPLPSATANGGSTVFCWGTAEVWQQLVGVCI